MPDEPQRKRRELSEDDRKLLAALGDRPEWDALREHSEILMEKHFHRVAREFMTAGTEPEYARLQWQRGVFAGMKFLLDAPTVEAKKLERLLENDMEV
jgi:hypothetical protein